MLVRRRADVNAVCDFDGDTPLHRAVREGHAAVCKVLIMHGAGKAHKNLEGLTVMQLSDRKKKADVIEALDSPVCPQEPSHGPDKALSPMPDSDGDLEDVLLISPMKIGAASGVTPNRAAGDAVEEDLERQAREALAFDDSD
ncbi:hypothetical protein T484DRAFT_3343185 [Baffinella frigidus]|nr:hypothetical protein T484DRAFT_3343185 [Cryptophyta sp. CCMP2293]